MGLLSDPSLAPRNKLGRTLAKHNRKICLLFYVAGIVWFVCLANNDLNQGTYLSENALSPGLVYPEIKHDSSRLAQTLLDELRREREEHKINMPYAWLIAKMKQIGLETHVHNFTLRYPYSGGKEFHGKNIYGILRAPRIGSTEGVVFSAPYRAPNSVHTDITASVPVLLAFADFARKNNYWAKDLVFLVTEQDQLGMQAWLKAYYEGGVEDVSILNFGNLPARAGALQAAVNLEIQELDIDYIDVKIEGLNGQLPNLDMFNLVQRITAREGILSGYKQTMRKKRRPGGSKMETNLKAMTAMLLSQATGIPNGNHGLFHRYRIEALTLEAVKRTTNSNNRPSGALPLLKTLEGISRSLNNLLERFHQSFFFYILVQNDRFVSIGDFMPCLVLLVGPMFLKAFLLWLTADDEREEADAAENAAEKPTKQWPYSAVLLFISVALGLGLLCNLLPVNECVREYFVALGLSASSSLQLVLGVMLLIALVFPVVFILPEGGLELLHVASLIFYGTALVVVGLLNFALGFLVAVISVPLVIFIRVEGSRTMRKTPTLVLALLLNPLAVVYTIVLVLTLFQFPELPILELLMRAASATTDAITFALMDYIIYGNWLYSVVTSVFFPLWTLWWTLALCKRPKSAPLHVKEKIN